MKFVTAACYEMLKNSKDMKMSAFLLVFPVIVIYILGHAIGSLYAADVTNKIAVGYVNEDTGVIGEQFDLFIRHKDNAKWLNVLDYADKGAASMAIKEGKLDGAIYLPSGLTELTMNGERQSIIVDGKRNVELIESIVGGFINSYNADAAVFALSEELPQPAQQAGRASIERIYYTKNETLPTMIDYYSVLTLLQILIIGALFGVNIVNKTANSDLHIRFHALPVSKWSLLFGQVAGSVVYLFIVSIAVMLFTKYVYGANWDGSPVVILPAMLGYNAIAIGIGLLIGTFVRSFSAALMAVMLLAIFFGAVSGAVSPAGSGGMMALLSPNYHAKMLIFGAIYGYSQEIMLEAALWLGAFALLIYGVSAVCIGRLKYDNI